MREWYAHYTYFRAGLTHLRHKIFTHPDPEERLANVQRWLGGYSADDEDTAQLVTTNEFAEFKELYRY